MTTTGNWPRIAKSDPFKRVAYPNKYHHQTALTKELEDPACGFVIRFRSRDIQKSGAKLNFTPEIQVTYHNIKTGARSRETTLTVFRHLDAAIIR